MFKKKLYRSIVQHGLFSRGTFLSGIIRTALLFLFIISLNISPVSAQGKLLLAGGGTEGNDGDSTSWSYEPYRWMVQNMVGDTLIILSQTRSTTIDRYFRSLGAKATQVYTIESDPLMIADAIDNAGGVWLRGGFQVDYIQAWEESVVEVAIIEHYQKGGIVGGTSAGAMVLSEFTSHGGPFSPANLADPFNDRNHIDFEFLGLLPNTIIDTHYFERARTGRLLGMLGNIYGQYTPNIRAIGIDALTALMIDENKHARVSGAGVVQFFYPNDNTSIDARPGRPLHVKRLPISQLTHGYEIDLADGTVISKPDDAVWVEGSSPNWNKNIRYTSDFMAETRLQLLHDIDGSEAHWLWVSPDTANYRYDTLKSIHPKTTLVPYDTTLFDDPDYAYLWKSADRLFLDLPDHLQLSRFLDDARPNGRILREEIAGQLPVELPITHLGQSGPLFAGNLSSDRDVIFSGRIKTSQGLALLDKTIVIPHHMRYKGLTERNREVDDRENRENALGWLFNQSGASIGIMGGFLKETHFNNGKVTFTSETNEYNEVAPYLIIDAREGYYTSQSPFTLSEYNAKPKNSAAISNAYLQVIPSGETWTLPGEELTSISEDDQQAEPAEEDSTFESSLLHELPYSIELLHVFPNPFNPTAKIEYKVNKPGTYSLQVFNISGRQIASQEVPIQTSLQGSLSIPLHHQSSGLYFFRLGSREDFEMASALLLK